MVRGSVGSGSVRRTCAFRMTRHGLALRGECRHHAHTCEFRPAGQLDTCAATLDNRARSTCARVLSTVDAKPTLERWGSLTCRGPATGSARREDGTGRHSWTRKLKLWRDAMSRPRGRAAPSPRASIRARSGPGAAQIGAANRDRSRAFGLGCFSVDATY